MGWKDPLQGRAGKWIGGVGQGKEQRNLNNTLEAALHYCRRISCNSRSRRLLESAIRERRANACLPHQRDLVRLPTLIFHRSIAGGPRTTALKNAGADADSIPHRQGAGKLSARGQLSEIVCCADGKAVGSKVVRAEGLMPELVLVVGAHPDVLHDVKLGAASRSHDEKRVVRI